MKNTIFKIITYVLWLGCTAAAIAYIYFAEFVNQQYGGNVWLYLLFFILSPLTATGIHELGHAVFGFFAGLGVKLSPKSLLPSPYASSVEIIPKRSDKLKSRVIVTTLGGIIFNLLFIALGLVALFVPAVPTWISPIAIWHLSLFFDNALPIIHSAGKSDGLVIYELIKNTPEAQVTLAVLTAQAHILSGKPIEELDKSVLFNLPQIREDDPSFISLCELRAEYLRATGNEEAARQESARFKELKNEYID